MTKPKSPKPVPEGCEACEQVLAVLLAANENVAGPESALVPRFRPVAELGSGAIFGHLASIHGPAESLLHSPRRLFEAARRLGKTADLHREYLRTAVERFASNQGLGYLVLPVLNGIAEPGETGVRVLAGAVEKAAMPAERVIVVHGAAGRVDGPRCSPC